MKYCVLLRGINVGGGTSLAMAKLKNICEKSGASEIATYIQSGNIVLSSRLSETSLISQLESLLKREQKRDIKVIVRKKLEIEKVVQDNPFKDSDPKKVGVMFFSKKVPKDFLKNVATTTGETVKIGKREIYIDYPNGMGRSKLKLPPFAKDGTVRNMNTVVKVAEMLK